MSRERSPDSLATRLLDFLGRNPDENLSLSDIAVKFDAAPYYVADVVRQLEHQGAVAVERLVRKPRS